MTQGRHAPGVGRASVAPVPRLGPLGLGGGVPGDGPRWWWMILRTGRVGPQELQTF